MIFKAYWIGFINESIGKFRTFTHVRLIPESNPPTSHVITKLPFTALDGNVNDRKEFSKVFSVLKYTTLHS